MGGPEAPACLRTRRGLTGKHECAYLPGSPAAPRAYTSNNQNDRSSECEHRRLSLTGQQRFALGEAKESEAIQRCARWAYPGRSIGQSLPPPPTPPALLICCALMTHLTLPRPCPRLGLVRWSQPVRSQETHARRGALGRSACTVRPRQEPRPARTPRGTSTCREHFPIAKSRLSTHSPRSSGGEAGAWQWCDIRCRPPWRAPV